MEITREMVDYVSALSRLRLDDGEAARMQGELQQIISYMDVLNTLDTTGVEPMSHVFPVENVLRADDVQPSCDRDALLSQAPAAADGAYLVPRTVEQGEVG